VAGTPKTSYVPNFKFVYARLGLKPGKKQSLSLLPDVGDLPGDGWKVLDEQTWRTGHIGKATDWAERARNLHSVTALRSFEQEEASRWLLAQVVPLANEPDAKSALSEVPYRFLRNRKFAGSITHEHRVDGLSVPGSAESWAYEQETTSDIGDGITMYLAGVAGSVCFMLVASASTGRWSWDDLTQLAELVVQRSSVTN
jgi:hypothetical protein